MALIATRLSLIKPSPTLAVTQKAAEMKRQGIDIISLGAGEPYFDTPDNIKHAAIKGINAGMTKYTDVGGTLDLKEAVCFKFKRDNNLQFNNDEVIVSTGGKQVIYNLFMASLNVGDEVIIPSPYWVSYPDLVLLSGGTPVIANCKMEDNFVLKPELLESLITPKTKWLILNSPSNPTGCAYYHQDLLNIAEVLYKYPHVNVMSDDIYEHIVFDNFKFYNLLQVAPDLKDRIFIVNGVSKAYSMTGWRIGYGAGSKDLIKAMTIIQSQTTSNPSSISQVAALEALVGPQDFIQTNSNDFQEKRDLVISILNKSKYLSCNIPQGAFYLFPKCDALFGLKTKSGAILNNSNDVAQYLLEEAKVAAVPGIAFGQDNHFRISYATSSAMLKEACQRIIDALHRL